MLHEPALPGDVCIRAATGEKTSRAVAIDNAEPLAGTIASRNGWPPTPSIPPEARSALYIPPIAVKWGLLRPESGSEAFVPRLVGPAARRTLLAELEFAKVDKMMSSPTVLGYNWTLPDWAAYIVLLSPR